MNQNLASIYADKREKYLSPVAGRLENLIRECLRDAPRIDRICARAKTVKSFVDKAGKQKNGAIIYSDPLNQIQDQLGVRVIVFFKSDVDRVATAIQRYFRFIEDQVIVPEKDAEFGYFGRHFIMLCPNDVFLNNDEKENCPNFFELQIKTLYQHAWSESNHDLGYKEHAPLSGEEKRKIAFTAAQSWGADVIFDELFASKR